MQKNSQIEFLRKKDYKFLKEIGQGGTGRTILIKDEIIDETFVCKKYSPFYEEHKNQYFEYFKNEIKILYSIYHINIVRVFNYYLYPEQTTGYILMEYIKGQSIDKYLFENPDKIEDVFKQTIDGFRYLEQTNILHRDIRPENILISDDGIVKIIDFGFGKRIDFSPKDKSISLNWRYAPPNEFANQVYDFKTEIYFIGKLFEEIITGIENIEFKYSKIISEMILADFDARIKSFFEIYREIIGNVNSDSEFSYGEKMIYLNFADNLKKLYSKLTSDSEYSTQIDVIIRNLEELHKNSILEDIIQNNNKLTRIFVNGDYNYFPKHEFKVDLLSSFIKLLKSVSEDKRKIILNNLWQRFDSLPRYTNPILDDDLPF